MKRTLSLLLCFLFLLSSFLLPVMATEPINESDRPIVDYDPTVNAYAAVILDMETGNVLYEYNADEQNYPASCTKIMTAYLCLKYGDIHDKVTVSDIAFSDLSDQASTGNFIEGEIVTIHQVLKCLLVVSASEAANVVAEYISGGIEEFVELMNREAQALGLENTHFVNTHGLPRSQHYTTARELATIAMAAMEYDVFREIVGASITTLDATNYNNATKIVSTNGLLPGSNEYNGEYNYPYAIGIKTGHTSVAGYNLVSAANKDGVEILTVVMGCVTRESSFAQTVKLFDWTYENYETLTWNWTTHEDHDTPEALKEAPEYEKPEIAVTEGPEVVEFIPVEPDSAEYSATESPNTSFQKESPADSQQGQPTASLFSRLQSQGYMGAVIILGITVLLLIILVIILIVILSNRRKARRRKRRKR